jgi:hypothetical protein
LGPQPLGDLKRGADFDAVTGQREREQPFGAAEAVEDRVAVGVQGACRACGIGRVTDGSHLSPRLPSGLVRGYRMGTGRNRTEPGKWRFKSPLGHS